MYLMFKPAQPESKQNCQHEEKKSTKKMKFDELSNKVFGCAIEVHRLLGPGLLESAYEQCLAHELNINNIDLSYNILYL